MLTLMFSHFFSILLNIHFIHRHMFSGLVSCQFMLAIVYKHIPHSKLEHLVTILLPKFSQSGKVARHNFLKLNFGL